MKKAFLIIFLVLVSCGGRDFRHLHFRHKPRWKKASLSAKRAEALKPLLLLPPSREAAMDGPVDLLLRRGEGIPGVEALALPPRFDSAALRIGGEQRSLELATLLGRRGFFFSFDRKRRISGDAAFAFAALPEFGVQDCGKVLFSLPDSDRHMPSASPAITARFGIELEIVPLLDPLALGPGAELPVRVCFKGRGLWGLHLSAEVLPLGRRVSSGRVFEGVSDESGMVLVPLRVLGLWVLRAEYRERGAEKGQASEGLLHRTFLSFRLAQGPLTQGARKEPLFHQGREDR